MDLSAIEKQLEKISQATVKVLDKHIGLDKQIERIRKGYQKAAGSFSGILDATRKGSLQFEELTRAALKYKVALNSFDTAGVTSLEGNEVGNTVKAYQEMLKAREKNGKLSTQALKLEEEYEQRMQSMEMLLEDASDQEKEKIKRALKIVELGTKQADLEHEFNMSSHHALESMGRSVMQGEKFSAVLLKTFNTNVANYATFEGIAGALGITVGLLAGIVIAVAAIAEIVYATAQSYFAINKYLMQANSASAVRLELARANLATSLETGQSLEVVGEAQQALLSSGQKLLATDNRTLGTMVKMSAALGISAEMSAELVRMSSRVGANFNDVAGSIAWLVNNGNLTSIEAAKLATDVSQLNFELGNTKAQIPQITASLGLMAGSLKNLGGSGDAVQKLVANFSSLQGLGSATLFGGSKGLIDPKAFSDADKLTAMVEHTGKVLQQMTGGNPMMLQSMGPLLQQMGLTIADAQALMAQARPEKMAELKRKMKEGQELTDFNTQLQQRYNEQLQASGEVFAQIKSIFAAAVRTGFIPLMTVITWTLPLITKLGQLLAWCSPEIKAVGWVLGGLGAVLIALVAVIGGIVIAPILALVLVMKAIGKIFYYTFRVGFMLADAIGTVFSGMKNFFDFLSGLWFIKKVFGLQSGEDKLNPKIPETQSKKNNIDIGYHRGSLAVRGGNTSPPAQPRIYPAITVKNSAVSRASTDQRHLDALVNLNKTVKDVGTAVKKSGDQQSETATKVAHASKNAQRIYREQDALSVEPQVI